MPAWRSIRISHGKRAKSDVQDALDLRRSSELRLSTEQQELPCLYLRSGLQAVQKQAGSERCSIVIPSIPPERIDAGLAATLRQRSHLLAGQVVYGQFHLLALWQGEADRRGAVEGVGEVLVEGERLRQTRREVLQHRRIGIEQHWGCRAFIVYAMA